MFQHLLVVFSSSLLKQSHNKELGDISLNPWIDSSKQDFITNGNESWPNQWLQVESERRSVSCATDHSFNLIYLLKG